MGERKESQVKFSLGLGDDGVGSVASDLKSHGEEHAYTAPQGTADQAISSTENMADTPTAGAIRRQDSAGWQSRASLAAKVYSSGGDNQMLVELDILQPGTDTWQEKARWIKYEENFDPGSRRWGKPHVASLSFFSLTKLKESIEEGLVLFDVDEMEAEAIWQTVASELVATDQLPEENKEQLIELLTKRHKHVNSMTLAALLRGESAVMPPHLPRRRSEPQVGLSVADRLHELNEEFTANIDDDFASTTSKEAPVVADMSSVRSVHHPVAFDNKALMLDAGDMVEAPAASNGIRRRKSNVSAHSGTSGLSAQTSVSQRQDIYKYLSDTAEATNIMVGEVDFLKKPITVFVRLDMAAVLSDIAEGRIATRFLFLALGPEGCDVDYYEVGRAFGALMATLDFQHLAWECMTKKALLNGIRHFLSDSLVLPAGEWDEELLKPIIHVARKKAAEVRRKSVHPMAMKREIEALNIDPYGDPLQRTGKPFGGMINDIKRRYPHYLSDIRDGLNPKCMSTCIFLFFACLAPAITFGGLLSEGVERWIGVSELLLATSVIGVVNGLLCTQPIKVIGMTGPMLLFETAFYQMCDALGIEYISAHVWVGVWIFIISFIVVATDASVLIRFVTRFTEEIFSALISLLFIYETFYKLYLVFQKHPLHSSDSSPVTNDSLVFINGTLDTSSNVTESAGDIANEPNTALLTLILTMGTFGLAYYLRFFRNGHYLGRMARRALGDFGIPIAILVMVLIDYGIKDTYTEKLYVPDGLQPTDASKRGWFIQPMGMNSSLPIWVIFGAVVPAIIAFILIFIETQIVNVIVNKPERKLEKGSGFHFDILLIGVFCLMSGFLGFPMMGVAAVRTITHINALSVYSNTNAPGEKPRLVHVYEQRVTIVVAHLIMGFTTLIGPVLRQVPLAVLFGVFLYMGVASMSGVQFFERVECFFMPVKYHPNEPYVQHVRTWKMHVFTVIQLLCLALLWAIKSTVASLAFPFVLLLMVPLRRYLLPCVFSDEELMYIDQTGVNKNNDSDDELIDDDLDFYEESKMSNIRSRRPTLPIEAAASAGTLAAAAGNGLGVEANNTSAPTIMVSHA